MDYDISFGGDLGAADEVVSLVSLIFSARHLIWNSIRKKGQTNIFREDTRPSLLARSHCSSSFEKFRNSTLKKVHDRYAIAFSNCVSDHSIFASSLERSWNRITRVARSNPVILFWKFGRHLPIGYRSRSTDEIRKEDLCRHEISNTSDYGSTCGINDQFSSQDITFILQKNVRRIS